jgi:hypothetical protein
MKMYYILIALSIFLTPKIFCSEKKDQFGIEWCFGRNPSLDEAQLRCLKTLDQTQIVKNGFADILRRRDKCPKCKEIIINEAKYLPYYNYPFLVINAEFVTRGTGIDVHFIFKNGLPLEFEALLIVNENNVNEFRVIETLDTNRERIKFIKDLRTKKFDSFWILAPL